MIYVGKSMFEYQKLKQMTVSELVKILSMYKPDLKISVSCGESIYSLVRIGVDSYGTVILLGMTEQQIENDYQQYKNS